MNGPSTKSIGTALGEATAPAPRDRPWAYALLAVGGYLALFLPVYTAIDDAYITFRYARNLADHGQLVLNLGERVEGITNLLWALILAAGHAIARTPIPSLAMHVAFLLLAFCLWRSFSVGRLLGLSPLLSVVASLFVFLNQHFLGAMANGLEGSLYSVLLAEMVFRYLKRHQVRTAIVAGLLVWTRPDGIVPVLLMAALVARGGWHRRDTAVSWVVIAAMIAGIVAFRVAYFGDFVPNSVLAKSFSPALLPHLRGAIVAHLSGFASQNALTLVVGVALAVLVARSRPFLGDAVGAVATFALACIAYSILVVVRNGGDWMPHFRLLMQYGVLYGFALQCLLRKGVFSGTVAVSLIVAQGIDFAFSLDPAQMNPWRISTIERPHDNEEIAAFWEDVTDRLAPVLEPQDVVSAEALGYISYTLRDTKFHDPLGLTDRYLARHGNPSATYGKRDPSYTLGRVRPSVAIWHYAGHLRDVDPRLLSGYTSYTPSEGVDWDADLVMVRSDRMEQLGSAFADWRRVVVTPAGVVDAGG